ncbi:MAG: Protein of unknown function (DUF1553)/Protein of unknown function (DUF1549)/Planctomycete, partial [Phycisphaerales bacterium]|nr:Protein of unknown function (DUF1553)/Protein of unknown function (DUF1549)/Planctomycete [Phycisphaerales bacterium]
VAVAPAGDGTGAATRLVVTMAFESGFARHQLGRFRLSLTDAPNPVPPPAPPADVRAALDLVPAARTDAQRSAVLGYFRRSVWAGGKALVDRAAAARAERDAFEKTVPTAMVMRELPKPRDTFVFTRGEYDKPGEKVAPGTPAFLPPLPAGEPVNRLALARWLVARDHPLTGRVTVNRYWQLIFGTGLVKTSDDFGSQGELPTHPELLDWLAAEFLDGPTQGEAAAAGKWDVRHLLRLYVTSATYRQASAVAPALLARDPENRLLARGTRHRLQAELIRDQALAASGLLDGRVGGASVMPYQPPGLWEELMSRGDGANWSAQTYAQSRGPDLYRRTMYTFWKRTSPPPSLATFDAPDRETCTVRRGRTNTPLQALVLMNDPTYVEAARKLAERALTEPPAGATDADRLALAFRAVLARKPRPEESTVLAGVLGTQRTKYAADPAVAAKLLGVGESPRDEKLDPVELAAWATVCGVVLNLDEAVTRG